MRYGALTSHLTSGAGEAAIEFFVTERPLVPGAYILGEGKEKPNVYVAESVAALVMQIYPQIEQMEREGQEALGFPAMDAGDKERMADRLTDSLIRRLSEDSRIWREEPEWLCLLRPAPGEV